MTNKKPFLLVVEPDEEAKKAAVEYFKDKAIAGFVNNYAGRNGVLTQIVYRDEKWRMLPQFDGVIINSFFPSSETNNSIDFGERTIKYMLKEDPLGLRIEAYEKFFSGFMDLKAEELRRIVRHIGSISSYDSPENDPASISFRQLSAINKELTEKLMIEHSKEYLKGLDSFLDHYDALRKAIETNPNSQPLGIDVAFSYKQRGVPFVLLVPNEKNKLLTKPIIDYSQNHDFPLVYFDKQPNEKLVPTFWRLVYDKLLTEMEKKK